jgi:hypothetical protein
MTAESAYVEVNECRVLGAGGEGAQWWVDFMSHQHPTRIKYARMTVAGGMAQVACDSRADAESLAAHMVSRGLHKTAVRAVGR